MVFILEIDIGLMTLRSWPRESAWCCTYSGGQDWGGIYWGAEFHFGRVKFEMLYLLDSC